MVSNESMRAIIAMQYRQWEELRTSLLLELEVQSAIASELKIDRSSIITDIESRLKECVLAFQVFDKKLKELV